MGRNASSSRIRVYKLGSDSVKFVLTVKRFNFFLGMVKHGFY